MKASCYLQHRILVLLALLGTAMGLTSGCDTIAPAAFETTPAGLAEVDLNFDKLPASNPQAKSVLPAAVGPAGSLFGLLLEDDSQIFVLGSIDANDDVSITGVVLLDENGNLVLRKDFTNSGAMLTFASGDSIDIDASSPNTRFTLTLNATTPPSVAVGTFDPETNTVIIDDVATQFEDDLNGDYAPNDARIRIADPSPRLKTSGIAGKDLCPTVGNALVDIVGVVCDIKSLMVKAAPEFVVNALCVGCLRALDLAKGAAEPGTAEFGVVVGVKTSITVACEGLKKAIDVGSLLTMLNPFDAACVAIGLANDGIAAATGDSLAEQVCSIFNSDQNLGGLLTDATSIQLSLLDTGVEDGDMIAIRHNGAVIFNGTVSTTAFSVDVNLASGLNHFEFEALNEGTLPPNTARVTVLGLDGSDLGNNVFDLSTGEVATLDIVRSS
ncbi:MAG: hypothetical protein MI923_01940 [Phycisphaerales bacterium]|nr:hypothetical protein [Phycisphaerales bacterium]